MSVADRLSAPLVTPSAPPPARRADAARNRERLLAAARAAFAESGPDASMAEVARRAGVGMATLYRNFPGRRELLEALYVDEVDAICAVAGEVPGDTPGERLRAWLVRFGGFIAAKHEVADELLAQSGRDDPVFDGSRDRVIAAGRPLLAAAQAAGEVREGLELEQVLDLVIAVGAIRGDGAYVTPILRVALDGLRP